MQNSTYYKTCSHKWYFFAIVQGSMSSLKAYTEEVKVNILTLALIEVEDTLHVLREF